MAKKFTELRARMPVESQQRADELAKVMMRNASQKVMAELLHVQQPAIAKLEKRTDMYLSTLRSHIEAMGGQLDVIARFADGSVRITHFADIDG